MSWPKTSDLRDVRGIPTIQLKRGLNGWDEAIKEERSLREFRSDVHRVRYLRWMDRRDGRDIAAGRHCHALPWAMLGRRRS